MAKTNSLEELRSAFFQGKFKSEKEEYKCAFRLADALTKEFSNAMKSTEELSIEQLVNFIAAHTGKIGSLLEEGIANTVVVGSNVVSYDKQTASELLMSHIAIKSYLVALMAKLKLPVPRVDKNTKVNLAKKLMQVRKIIQSASSSEVPSYIR